MAEISLAPWVFRLALGELPWTQGVLSAMGRPGCPRGCAALLILVGLAGARCGELEAGLLVNRAALIHG